MVQEPYKSQLEGMIQVSPAIMMPGQAACLSDADACVTGHMAGLYLHSWIQQAQWAAALDTCLMHAVASLLHQR